MQDRTCATRRFSWVVMPEEFLVLLARVFGIAGVMLLAMSAVLGVLLASRAAQRLRLLKGRTFRIHRLLCVLGADRRSSTGYWRFRRAGRDRRVAAISGAETVNVGNPQEIQGGNEVDCAVYWTFRKLE